MNRQSLTIWRKALLALLAVILVLGGWPVHTARGQEGGGDAYLYEECARLDEAGLRDELNRLTQQIFAEGQGSLNIAGMVQRHWIDLNMDGVIDREVDRAVQRIYNEQSYWDRLLSGWSTQKAQEFTEEIITNAFGSESFRQQIELLANRVAGSVAAEMTAISAQSASSALLCIQAFIGDSYSASMAALFEAEIASQIDDLELVDVDADILMILESRGRTLAGIGVIIGSQIAQRLAQALARRIAGQVAGRILGRAATAVIPIAGWIIGGGLIVLDLIEGGQGSLPQIQAALTEPAVKAGIRDEVVVAVGDELRLALPEIARAVSNDIHSQWLDFRRRYARVINLANSNPRFRQILDSASAGEIEQISALIVVTEQILGQEGLNRMIDQGQLEQMLGLPGEIVQILRATGDPGAVIAWANLAGGDLGRVIELEVFRAASPEDFVSRAELSELLALNDRDTIAELMLLSRGDRERLLRLTPASVITLSTLFDRDDLTWLASYFAGLEPRDANILVDQLRADPGLMAKLRSEAVREAILSSGNVDETLAFLRPEASASPIQVAGEVLRDAERLAAGDVTWLLFWRKHGTWQNFLYLGGAILALGLLIFLLWRRARPLIVNVHVPNGPSR